MTSERSQKSTRRYYFKWYWMGLKITAILGLFNLLIWITGHHARFIDNPRPFSYIPALISPFVGVILVPMVLLVSFFRGFMRLDRNHRPPSGRMVQVCLMYALAVPGMCAGLSYMVSWPVSHIDVTRFDGTTYFIADHKTHWNLSSTGGDYVVCRCNSIGLLCQCDAIEIPHQISGYTTSGLCSNQRDPWLDVVDGILVVRSLQREFSSGHCLEHSTSLVCEDPTLSISNRSCNAFTAEDTVMTDIRYE